MSTLDAFRDDFIQEIDESLNLIQTVNQIRSIIGLPINLSIRQRDTVIEWAFVNLHSAWENFLENCFLAYMLGGQTISGYRPARYVFPSNKQHALGIILAGRDFFPWTIPKRVVKQADLCFDNGEPFRTVLDSAATDLSEINTIRNAIVHRSTVALDNFKILVRQKLRSAPLGITPGIFLATTKPKMVQMTFLNSYCNKLRVIATKIVPQ